jgi:hypothetical protein
MSVIMSAVQTRAGVIPVAPSGDATGAKDVAAINAALVVAGKTGGVVQLQPGGQYTVNAPIRWTAVTSGATTQPDGLAPSLVGSPARPGTSHDIGPLGNTLITAASSFPSGEFMIDYVASTTTANVGFTVEGLMLACAGKAAGIRGCNQIQATWRNIVIDNTATPSPANNFGLLPATGAFSFVANPSVDANNNFAYDCYVAYAGQDAFCFVEGNGSWAVATNCFALDAGRTGFVLGDNTLAMGCREQGSGAVTAGGAAFSVYNATMIGCHSGDVVTPNCNSLQIQGQNSRSARIIGCRFTGTNNNGLSQANASMIQVPGNVAIDALIQGNTFISGTNTYSWLYVNGGVTGVFDLEGNHFATTALGGSALIGAALTLFGTPTYAIRNNQGINPAGTQTVAVPASTVAIGAQTFDCVFYVTGAAGGSCSIALSNGPTVVVPASGTREIYLPAWTTFTPTYGAGNAPTWVVQGL